MASKLVDMLVQNAQNSPLAKEDKTKRQAKAEQRYRLINKADTAATTGNIINPVGAVIPNPTGAGGQAGAQGGFGYGNPSYMNPNLRPQNVAGNNVVPLPAGPSYTANTNTRVKLGNGQIVSMPANTTMNFTQQPTMNVFQSAADVLMGRNTPGSMFYDNSGNSGVAVSRGNATMSTPGKGGNVNPSLVPVRQQQAYGGTAGYWANYNQQNGQNWLEKFYGAVGGGLQDFIQQTNSPTPDSFRPLYKQAVENAIQANIPNVRNDATQAYLQGEKGYVPIPAPILSRLDKERQALNKPTTPYGTAGMYTYGQFSDKDQAFTQLLAAGIPTTIPAAIADNLGLSQTLQSPGSGWKLQNGAWVNTGAQTQAMNPGNTDYTQTQFYRDYVSNEVPFEEQLRYDPKTGKYVRVGDWLKKKNDPRYTASREAKQAQKRRQMFKMGRDEVQASYQSAVMEAPAPFTGSWGVVSFNTGSG